MSGDSSGAPSGTTAPLTQSRIDPDVAAHSPQLTSPCLAAT